MKNLERLLDLYRLDSRVQNIANALAVDTPARLQLVGMMGAQEAFVLAGIFLARPAFHLFIATDKEEAAYLLNSLETLFDKKPIHFFPDSFKRPMNFAALNSTNSLQRTETINKLNRSKAKGEILITYPEALFEKVVAPEVLNKEKIDIQTNEKIDVDFIIELLVTYGFSRVDFVYEPGQFSIRGGIVDIFSYGNEYPYRVELFDDEVESIRTFDPTTQLSQRNIARVTIIPNINTQFDQEQKVSLFQVLPPNTTIWLRDFQLLLDNDGDLDVLSASARDDHIIWFKNEGVGQFSQPITVAQEEDVRSIYASDLDGDGDTDVLSVISWKDKIVWYENQGDGQFSQQKIITTQAKDAGILRTGDIDMDGDVDIISTSSDQEEATLPTPSQQEEIVWYENLGEEQFSQQKNISTPLDWVTNIQITDLDGDQDVDILCTSFGDNLVAWYENENKGQFSQQKILSAQANRAMDVHAADLNGDGNPEVLSAASQFDKLAWHENLLPPLIESVQQDTSLGPTKIFPNPFYNYIILENTAMMKTSATLTLHLYDALGREVSSFSLTAATQQFPTTHIGKGIYFYVIVDEADEVTGQGKLIKP